MKEPLDYEPQRPDPPRDRWGRFGGPLLMCLAAIIILKSITWCLGMI